MAGPTLGAGSASDFMDDIIGGERGLNLGALGPACQEIAQHFESPLDASPAIATVLWSMVRHGRDCRERLATMGIDHTETESYVIAHPLFVATPRFDLLVFADGMRDRKPELLRVGPPSDPDEAAPIVRSLPKPLQHSTDLWLSAAEEVFAEQEFAMIVAEAPGMLTTAGITCRAPDPPLAVRMTPDSPVSCSAGIAGVRDGDSFITTALHVLRESPSAPLASVGTEVWVGTDRATVVATDQMSDSVILKLDAGTALDLSLGDLVTGPLAGVTPRHGELAHFNGATSKRTDAYVNGWSPDLLLVQPWNQVKVTTTPVSVPGDSGAALHDDDGRLIGFAHAVTDFDVPFPMSTWIWADSVVQAHRLQDLALTV
jgi:hypothetical protein